MAEPVDKLTLVRELRWSRPRLDFALAVWDDFPVVTRGTQRGGWAFDLEAVRTYLKTKPALVPRAQARNLHPGPGSALVVDFDGARLCEALGWPQAELERRLDYDGDFPALVRGGHCVAWAFDLEDVRQHVERQAAIESARSAELCAAVACHVSKGELARILNWGPSQLYSRLLNDRDFPVLARGKARTVWSFDLAKVRRHLGYAGSAGATLSVDELARALRWERARLDVALGAEGFPVVTRGGEAGGWAAFDLAAVAACVGVPRAASLSVRGIGKKSLAQELGVSRPTLDAMIDADPAFPVISRGTQRGGWLFDLEAVRTYLPPK